MTAAIDLFAGPGGWDVACQHLGIDVLGVEWDKAACDTALAAGHRRLWADVAALDPRAVAEAYRWTGFLLIGSPSCTLFSSAGKGTGRLVLDVLARGIARIFAGDDPAAVIEATRAAIAPVARTELEKANRKRAEDKRRTSAQLDNAASIDAFVATLVLEPARWIVALDPENVALEQVPEVLPLWQAYIHALRSRGYSAWTGVLNSANFGVPQTRERAILIASRTGVVAPPEPTHAEHEHPEDMFGGTGREKWVSMAQALGWAGEYRHAYGAGMVQRHGDRDTTKPHEPAPTITGKARSDTWVVRTGNNTMKHSRAGSRAGDGGVVPYERSCDEPAPTVDTMVGSKWVIRTNNTTGTGYDGTQRVHYRRDTDRPSPVIDTRTDLWAWERPATTVQGDPRIGRPGHKDRDKGESQFAEGSVRVTVEEAGILQSFAADYPWQGSRTKQFQQVGNAVPPLLAEHVLRAVTANRTEAAA